MGREKGDKGLCNPDSDEGSLCHPPRVKDKDSKALYLNLPCQVNCINLGWILLCEVPTASQLHMFCIHVY